MTGSHFDLADVLIRVLRQTAACLQRLALADALLFEEWQSLCLLKGHLVRLESGSRQLVGICRGIDQEGALILDTDAGVERAFGGVVSRIEPERGTG
jgi:BirA family biotin operon repressor/biotin-[acetyl-CoA-carboxylase] ligase